MRVLLLTALLLVPALAGCSGSQKTLDDQVVIETDLGDIVIQLEAEKAPATVENFLKYVDAGFYDGTLFHRIIEGFMIQGGGMGTDGQFKDPLFDPVVNEARDSGLKNEKYTISMARTNAPDSATNQFFINHADNSFLDPNGGAGYAVFGRVVEGQDVVDAIAAVPVEPYRGQPGQNCQNDGQPSCPVDDVVIHTIRRATTDEDPTPAQPREQPPEPIACASAEPAHTPADIQLTDGVDAGLITPHVWNLCSTEEKMLLWVHNGGNAETTVELAASVDGGADWQVTFEDDNLTLAADGTKGDASSGRTTYPDWGWTVMHLTVPEGASGTHALNVTVGSTTVEATLVVAPEFDRTLERGDITDVTFDGDFADDGEGFWEGTIPNIDVGSGGLVTGVDLGLLGLGYQETAALVVPPALAYGYDNPEGSGFDQFNGEWLLFTVTVDDL